MAVTKSQTTGHGVNNIAVGRYIDTGTVSETAARIYTGFKPRYVRVDNLGGSGLVIVEFFEGMTAAHAIKTSIAGARSEIASLGITVYDDGFLIGGDTDVLVSSEQLTWLAIG